MTHPTKAIYALLLADYLKISKISASQRLYDEDDLEKSLKKIKGIDFHETIEVNGIKFRAFHAGHVLGAAMFAIEIGGVKILYTGDYSREEDRHLMAAEMPHFIPHILITESTYGTKLHDKREDREARFTSVIHNTVSRGGRCLIPVFALGRAQELLLILEEYWGAHPELHEVPIYYASALAQRCLRVYQTFFHSMNASIRRIAKQNPFSFKFIRNLKTLDHFDDIGPCVVLASPGMMQSGISRELFESWCGDPKNTCIIAGYCIEGTPAKQILDEPATITTMTGQIIPRNCKIESISFSAHVDYQQNSEFIWSMKPKHIVLVHGEAAEMERLRLALHRECPDAELAPKIYTPANLEAISLNFPTGAVVKVMGKLAEKFPVPGQKLSGILAKKEGQYYFLDSMDLPRYLNIPITTIEIKLHVPFCGSLEDVVRLLSQYGAQIEQDETRKYVQLRNEIAIYPHTQTSVTFVYDADRRRRMIVHAAIALLLKHNESQLIDLPVPSEDDIVNIFKNVLIAEKVESEGKGIYIFESDENKVKFDLYNGKVISADEQSSKFKLDTMFMTPAYQRFKINNKFKS